MRPIFDKDGKTVSWLSKDVIYDLRGETIAFIKDKEVFNYVGKYIGIFENGFFRDKSGHAVAFLTGAYGGPSLPSPEIPPVPPVPATHPIPSSPPAMSEDATVKSMWSRIQWNEFLE